MVRKLFFFAALFFSLEITAQTRAYQYGDFIYLYNSSTMTINQTCDNNNCFQTISNNTDTLARIYRNNIVFWKGTIINSSISDTLSASGITGVCRITVPSTINTQRVFQVRELGIIYSTTNYHVEYLGGGYNLPVRIIHNNGTLYCTIDEGGGIDWNTTPQWSWLGRVGTTRIKRITLP